MSDNTGAAIGMTAGAIAFANEFINDSGNVNWRILVATPIAGAFLYGAGKISEPLATGLGIAMLVTVFMTPFGNAKGATPMQTVSNLLGSGKTG